MTVLFPKVRKPYYIYSPPYNHKSSGVRTLHLLCHALNEIGEKAYMYIYGGFISLNPELNTPLFCSLYMSFYKENGIDPIAIYPDIVRGNPLPLNNIHIKNVVRYLLAPAGVYGGDSIFPESDNIWGALPSLADKVLRIPVSDTSIFYPPGLNDISRNGSCFYSHKYEMHGNFRLPISQDSLRLEGTLENIANILRKSEVCYLYELSSIITEAALCACPVVLVRTTYFNTIDSSCMMGNVKWSDGEIVKECSDYLTEYKEIVQSFWANLQAFIKDTQEMV